MSSPLALAWALSASLQASAPAPAAAPLPAPAAAASPQPPAAAPPTAPARFTDAEYALGSPSAKVVVVEYFSDTCSHCAAFDRQVFPYVRQKYIDTGLVRYVFRELPTAPTQLSALGFLIARCAGRENYLSVVEQFLESQAWIFDASDTRQVVLWMGDKAGLNPAQTQACIDDDDAFARLNARIDAAAALGVESTPTFLFNGRMIQPDQRLAGEPYEGGELTLAQFDAAYRMALRAAGGEPARPALRARARKPKPYRLSK